MSTLYVELDQARGNFDELLEKAARGDEIVITRDKKPMVRLVPSGSERRRKFGSARGLIEVPEDFDEPLDDFADYV